MEVTSVPRCESYDGRRKTSWMGLLGALGRGERRGLWLQRLPGNVRGLGCGRGGRSRNDEGLELLKDLMKLRRLRLSGAPIREGGLQHLKGLPNLSGEDGLQGRPNFAPPPTPAQIGLEKQG